MSVVSQIAHSLISAALIVETDIDEIIALLRAVCIDADHGLMIFGRDTVRVVVHHTEQDQSVHVPGRDALNDLRDIIGNIQHHIVAGLTNSLFNTADHLGYKWIT